MIHDIPKPEISPAFTIDDIHKIREWHYERLKDATMEERLADTRRRASAALAAMDAIRRSEQSEEKTST
jgi:3-deoxy-D-arabino-heptulosonate 7-phosphate (DAHP) synthase class II